MIPQMSRVFADKKGWVTQEEILDYYAVAQSLPGAVAINTSILIGFRLEGAAGAYVAAFGSVLPSFIVLIPVTIFYQAFITNEIMLGAMRGIRAAVVALLFSTVWKLMRGSVKNWLGAVLAVSAAVLTFALDINPVYLLLGGAAIGIIAVLPGMLRVRKGGV